MVHSFKHVTARHGMLGLYRGLSAMLVFTAPRLAARFGAKQFA